MCWWGNLLDEFNQRYLKEMKFWGYFSFYINRHNNLYSAIRAFQLANYNIHISGLQIRVPFKLAIRAKIKPRWNYKTKPNGFSRS